MCLVRIIIFQFTKIKFFKGVYTSIYTWNTQRIPKISASGKAETLAATPGVYMTLLSMQKVTSTVKI